MLTFTKSPFLVKCLSPALCWALLFHFSRINLISHLGEGHIVNGLWGRRDNRPFMKHVTSPVFTPLSPSPRVPGSVACPDSLLDGLYPLPTLGDAGGWLSQSTRSSLALPPAFIYPAFLQLLLPGAFLLFGIMPIFKIPSLSFLVVFWKGKR